MVTGSIGQQLDLCRKRGLIVAPALVIIGILHVPVMVRSVAMQAPPTRTTALMPDWQRTAGCKAEFADASVTSSKPGMPRGGNITLDALDGAAPRSNSIRANYPLFVYINFAYKIADIGQHQALLAQLPKWAQSVDYNIVARAEGTPTRDQFRLMMQSLLQSRFGLTMHMETRQRTVYALVLDKPGRPGPQLYPHPNDKPCMDNPTHSPTITAPANGVEPPYYCGLTSWPVNGQVHLRMIDVTMEQIADFLPSIGGPVESHLGLDLTGLKGRFDLVLEFKPYFNKPGIDSGSTEPAFALALRDQLGLKLVEQEHAVNMFVIDNIEMPSEK